MKNSKKICPLCGRDNLPELTEHHVVPKSRGGSRIVLICRDCHKQIHALFDNKTLEKELNSVKKLKENKKIIKFIKWIKKRPYGAAHKIKRSKNTRNRKRSG